MFMSMFKRHCSSHHRTHGGTEEEDCCDDLMKPRKVHHKTSKTALSKRCGPVERDKMDAQIRIPQQRCAEGYSDVEVGGRREGLDIAYD